MRYTYREKIFFEMNIPLNYVSPKESLAIIQSNQRVFIHGSAHTPTYLLEHLAKEAYRLENVEIVSISVYGDLHVDKPEYKNSFHLNSLFVSASVRNAVNTGHADYVPVFLSEIPELFKQNILPRYVIAQVNPNAPRTHGDGLIHNSRFHAMVYCGVNYIQQILQKRQDRKYNASVNLLQA